MNASASFGLMIVSFALVLVVALFLLGLGITQEKRIIKPPSRRYAIRRENIRKAVREAHDKQAR